MKKKKKTRGNREKRTPTQIGKEGEMEIPAADNLLYYRRKRDIMGLLQSIIPAAEKSGSSYSRQTMDDFGF